MSQNFVGKAHKFEANKLKPIVIPKEVNRSDQSDKRINDFRFLVFEKIVIWEENGYSIKYLFDEIKIDPSFWLWLTSEENPDFSS